MMHLMLISTYGVLLAGSLGCAGWAAVDAYKEGNKSEGYSFFGDLLVVGILLALAGLFSITIAALSHC